MNDALPNRSGIYRITVMCGPSDRKHYIGQSRNLRTRWGKHRLDLRRGTHWNDALQLAYNEYGEQAFSVRPVIICEPRREVLARYEQAVVDLHDRSELFNMRLECVTSGLGVKATEARKAKISAALKGRPKSEAQRAALADFHKRPKSAEYLAKLSAAQKGKKASPEQREAARARMVARYEDPEERKRVGDRQLGRQHSAETKEKIGNANRSRVISPETVEKLSAARRGKKHTEEHKAKIADGMRRSHKENPRAQPTEEAIERLRLANIGRKQTPEHRAKGAASRRGMKRSEETKAKMRASALRFLEENPDKRRVGYAHGPETREKIRTALLRHFQKE